MQIKRYKKHRRVQRLWKLLYDILILVGRHQPDNLRGDLECNCNNPPLAVVIVVDYFRLVLMRPLNRHNPDVDSSKDSTHRLYRYHGTTNIILLTQSSFRFDSYKHAVAQSALRTIRTTDSGCLIVVL